MADDLRAEFEAAKVRTNPVRCPVGKALQAIEDKEVRETFERSLLDHGLSSTVISRVMTNRGHGMSDDAVQRHRRAQCACERLLDAS